MMKLNSSKKIYLGILGTIFCSDSSFLKSSSIPEHSGAI